MADKGYDPKKAATWNQLIKQGLSVEEAGNQAGIPDDERGNYVEGEDGTIGTWNAGWGKSTIGAFQPGEVEKVPYDVKAKDLPSSRTSDDYTDTSTEQYSGKAVFIAATKPKDTAASLALQPAIDASYEKSQKFLEENPSAYARKKLGLPKMSAAEQAAWNNQDTALEQERRNLIDQQNDLKTPGVEAKFEIPNTTNNTVTTTFGTESTNAPVESADAALAQQQELQAAFRIDQINTAPLSPVVPTDVNPLGPVVNVIAQPDLVPLQPGNNESLGPVTNVVVEPALVPLEPGNSDSLGPVANVIAEPEPVPVDDPAAAAAAADFNANTNAGVLGAIGVTAPAPVAPGPDSPFGGGPFNNAAARNPEAAVDAVAAAEAAQQAATEARLREQQAIQAQFQSPANGDWRVKLKLPPGATYLYKDGGANSILAPLAASDGVVFPYMPEIQTTYNANYDTTDLTHSNYRGYFYKSSYVGDIGITGVFTAQNTQEANYLLAVIHFFRSATKMFYGSQDSQRGTPPPLVYLFGLGQYQFNAHPCVIRSFNYNLPNDVDYIRTKPNNYNVNLNNTLPKTQSGGNPISAVINRLRNALLPKGALPNVPQQLLTVSQSVNSIDNSTYVPTKITVQINLLPIQTRNQQSQQFSVKGFANGDLLKGGFW